jgi:Zn-finger nucleic acid-binding protein
MKCPVCDVALSISSREGVEIDFCPQCRGVWLDRGELDKIIDRVAVTQSTPGFDEPPREAPRDDRGRESYAGDSRGDWDDDRYRTTKKKQKRGFLEDLFDFD